MFTRFSTPKQTHLFAPGGMLRYSSNGPGASFLGMLGGAYESETEERVADVTREATLLLTVLQEPSSAFHVSAPRFASCLERLLRFLHGCNAQAVSLYSYEKSPTLDDLLAAELDGGGADDWAIEEVLKRGVKIIPKLEAVLSNAGRSHQHLSAVRLLLFCFPATSREIVQRFVDSAGETEAKYGAAMLLAATAQAERPRPHGRTNG